MATVEDKRELRTYRGNCHCGAYVYEARLPELKTVAQCNCSICTKKGYLWHFAGADADFHVVHGSDDSLTSYTFGSGKLIHKFCSNCATPVLATLPDAPPGGNLALNVHAIQGVDTWGLVKNSFDGASRGIAYVPHEHKGLQPSATLAGGKLYTGGCHCGAVTIAVFTNPIEGDKDSFVECNCSVCERNGYIWIYPKNEQVVVFEDERNIGRYSFGAGFLAKTFCKTCGVNLTNAYVQLPENELAKWPEKARSVAARHKTMTPVNVRVLDGVELEGLKIEKFDGYNMIKPGYQNP